jgi:hypothetical protein
MPWRVQRWHNATAPINALNDRIAAFIQAHATDKQAGPADTATDN